MIPAEVLIRLIDLHARTAHPAVSTGTVASITTKAEKVKRPTISASGTSEEWAYFLLRWSDYKAATHLAGPDVIYQLLECCDDGLRKDLSRIFGALASQDEPTVLSHIKTLAVRRENIMVFRVNYSRCGRTEMNLYGHLLPASMAKQASASTRSLVPAIMMWTIVLPWCEIP